MSEYDRLCSQCKDKTDSLVGGLFTAAVARAIMAAHWENKGRPGHCPRCNAIVQLTFPEVTQFVNSRLLHGMQSAGWHGSLAELTEEVERACTCTAPTKLEAVQVLYRETEGFTKRLLETMPRTAKDASILPHALKSMAGDRRVSFGRYGGKFGADPLSNLHSIPGESEKGWELTLTSPPEWSPGDSAESLVDDGAVKQAFVPEAAQRIATSLGVAEGRVQITGITKGSVKVAFTVDDLTPAEKVRILKADVTGKLSEQFNTFVELRIEPVVLALHFDLDQLDDAGNKVFENGETYRVGPPGNSRNYHQPTGWTRYGFKVLGKHEDDTWLHPFQHQNNWYRAFHGTGRAKDSAGAARGIVAGGFRESTDGKIGSGVYVSPFAEYSGTRYCGGIELETKEGWSKFKYILQVAVKPGSIMREGYPKNFLFGDNQEWTAPASAVRPYGLLIKEA